MIYTVFHSAKNKGIISNCTLSFNKLFSRYECLGKNRRLKIRVIIIITTLMGTGCSSHFGATGQFHMSQKIWFVRVLLLLQVKHFTEIKNTTFCMHDMTCVSTLS